MTARPGRPPPPLEDVEIGGRTIRGTGGSSSARAANRDPARFPAPMSSMSGGPTTITSPSDRNHYCLGGNSRSRRGADRARHNAAPLSVLGVADDLATCVRRGRARSLANRDRAPWAEVSTHRFPRDRSN